MTASSPCRGEVRRGSGAALFAGVFAACLVAIGAAAEERIALLIANQAYSEDVGRLVNPHNDVAAIREALIGSGFDADDITVVHDASRTRLLAAVEAFAARAADLTADDIAFFYYSGHGAARPGRDAVNLIPVNVAGVDSTDFWYDTVDFDVVIEMFQGARSNAAWIVAVDACRNELRLPVRALGGDGEKGFGVVPTAAGMLIAFAADSRQTARDQVSDSMMSPYAQALVEELNGPARAASAVFSAVRPKVIAATGGAQEPVSTLRLNRDPLLGRPGTGPSVAERLARENAELLARLEAMENREGPSSEVLGGLGDVDMPGGLDADHPAFRFGLTFRDPLVSGGSGPVMVVIPAGEFVMGSPDSEEGRFESEGTQRTVRISMFAAGKFEVTWDDWNACVNDGGCDGYRPADEGWGQGTRPVMNVSWNDAQEYVRWLSRQTGQTYRLLTEAEWEYAAQAGTTTAYSTGSSIGASQANLNYAVGQTQPVGFYAANAFGLHDMHGNVWEWVEDCWHDNYSGAPTDGSAWTSGVCSQVSRVVRGGSWVDPPRLLRSGLRSGTLPTFRGSHIGFRVARTL